MRGSILVVALSMWFSGYALAQDEPLVGDPATGEVLSAACAGCHGADGNSAMPDSPCIAGQLEDAALKQLLDYRDGAREHEFMTRNMAALSDQNLADLAAFYADKVPARQEVPFDGTLEAGRTLWEEGRRSEGIAPCTGCHGRRGQGYPGVVPGSLPQVGAHPAEYVDTQLRAFRDGTRTNDYQGMMRDVCARLSNDDIRALAAYTASLVPAP